MSGKAGHVPTELPNSRLSFSVGGLRPRRAARVGWIADSRSEYGRSGVAVCWVLSRSW